MIVRRLLLLVLCPLLSLPASAQTPSGTGSLQGTVVDPSGAAIAGAKVIVAATSEIKTTSTDHSGGFVIPALPPGPYSISVEAPGFDAGAARVAIAAGEDRTFTINLRIAAVRDTVTVGSGRLGSHEPLEPRLPGSYESIDRAELDRLHAPSVNEALRKVSGVIARDEEGFGLRPNIALRGLNPTRSSKVLLLEDGVPLAFAPYGDNASYYHPPIERFDAIEVLKGSGQVAYGPSTIGGVINYLTPMPPAHPSGTAMLAMGNRSFVDAVGTFGSTRGAVGFFVDAMRKQGDGARDHTYSALSDFNAKLVVSPSPSQIFTAKGTYYRERSRVTYSGLRDDEFARDPRQNPFENDAFRGDRAAVSLAHHLAAGSRLTVASTGYLSRFERHWWRQSSNSAQRPNDSADPACGGMANLLTTCGNEGRLRRYVSGGLESRVRVRFGAAGESEIGGRMHGELQDRRQANGDNPTARSGVVVEDNDRRAKALSAFAQHRFSWRNMTLAPGIRVEHIAFERTNRLGDGGHGVAGNTTLTTAIPGVGGAVNIADRAVLFAGIHRGFAPPRVEDVISNAGGLTELEAELSWNSEIGVRARLRDGVRIDATWFRMAYANQVVPASLAGGVGAALTNGGRTRHEGFEVSARADALPGHAWTSGAYARVAYSYVPVAAFRGMRFSAIRGFETVSVTGNRLPYAPAHVGSARFGYAYSTRADAFVELVATSEQFADDLNTVTSTPDGQRGLIPTVHTWNAGLNVRLPARLTLFGVIYNVADRTYISDRSRGILPGPPRRVQVGVKVQF